MMRKTVMLTAMLLAAPAMAEIDGHGPDAWRVTGVAPDDVLNMRMGPGTDYKVIDRLAPDARGLTQVTCVPLMIQPYAGRLTDAERAALPQRWCLMRSADLMKSGWVAQRFLSEDGLQDASGPAADPDAGGDPVGAMAARFMQGYRPADVARLLDDIETVLKPRDSAFLPYGDLSPPTLAVLALEAGEGPRSRVRYRIRWGIGLFPNAPKAVPLSVSFVQVDRFSLGSRIRDEMAAAHGADIVGTEADFDVGPHVSWRMVSSPVMGIRASVHEFGQLVLSDAEAAGMTCLGAPCLGLAMQLDDAANWSGMEEFRPDLDTRYEAVRHDILSPAAVIDLLAGDIDSSEMMLESEGKPMDASPPGAFFEAVIEVNLAMDSAIDGAARLGGLLDDSIAAEWQRVTALPSDAMTPKVYRAASQECHRGSRFAPAGGLCP